jgi:hypothetical protein
LFVYPGGAVSFYDERRKEGSANLRGTAHSPIPPIINLWENPHMANDTEIARLCDAEIHVVNRSPYPVLLNGYLLNPAVPAPIDSNLIGTESVQTLFRLGTLESAQTHFRRHDQGVAYF